MSEEQLYKKWLQRVEIATIEADSSAIDSLINESNSMMNNGDILQSAWQNEILNIQQSLAGNLFKNAMTTIASELAKLSDAKESIIVAQKLAASSEKSLFFPKLSKELEKAASILTAFDEARSSIEDSLDDSEKSKLDKVKEVAEVLKELKDELGD